MSPEVSARGMASLAVLDGLFELALLGQQRQEEGPRFGAGSGLLRPIGELHGVAERLLRDLNVEGVEGHAARGEAELELEVHGERP